MSDDPNQQPPHPLDADPGAPTPPMEPVPSAVPTAPTDATDPTVVWAPTTPVAPTVIPPVSPAPAADSGLISAAPVGWTGHDIGGGAATPPTLGTPATGTPTPSWAVGATPPAPPPPPAGTPPTGSPMFPVDRPAVSWEAPPAPGREVPGAPGLRFSDTASRFMAYVLDVILIAIVAVIIGSAAGLAVTTTTVNVGTTYTESRLAGGAFGAISTVLSLLYFVGFWSGGRRATPGQRLFGIQVGNAFDGQPLSLSQAVRRWLGLGSFLALFALIPSLGSAVSGIETIWILVLFVSTILSPTKQGLHDKIANSAVVRPSGARTSGCVWACIVVLVLLFILGIVVIVAGVVMGDQFLHYLSQVGRPT